MNYTNTYQVPFYCALFILKKKCKVLRQAIQFGWLYAIDYFSRANKQLVAIILTTHNGLQKSNYRTSCSRKQNKVLKHF